MNDASEADKAWAQTRAALRACDGLILVSPEWNGMASPALTNVLLLASRGELAHKPALIVTVSTGGGGAYPVAVAELRASSGKNTRLCYVPDHVVVRSAEQVLNTREPVDEADEADEDIRERIRYSLSVFRVYTDAFGPSAPAA